MENLSNIVSKSPILEHAAFGKGNLTVKGTVTKKEVERLAIEWIGEKPILTSNGGMISSDGTRRIDLLTLKRIQNMQKVVFKQILREGIQIVLVNLFLRVIYI